MEENPVILVYSHKKLDEVPQEILDHGRTLEELYLDSNDIELLPKGIFNLPKLKVLSVCDNNLCELSKFLGSLDCVETLDVSKNCISEFPDSIENCTQLLELDASVNPILKLPDGLFNLSHLTHLILNETFMECLPEDIGKLSQLKVLELRQNQLSDLPKSMQNLRQLERLDIGSNKFIDLPIAVGCMTNLQELLADGNVIGEIPPVIGLLRNLILLDLSMNKVESLPSEIESMNSLTDLYLSANELLELPETIGSLSNLETLKLDENDLLFLPSSIGRLEMLEELDVNTNNLEGLPCSMGQLTKLKALNLDNNCIKSLPEELGSCASLSLLSLRSNNLVRVPASLGQLHNLQMINLSANMLNFLPLTFLDLKNLKALWLSENQSNPVVSMETKFDEKEKKEVVTCNLLPQKTWDDDQSELDAESEDENISNLSVKEKKVEKVEAHEDEAIRTRGSISQSLVNKCKSEHNHATPWYEQEFIESVDDHEVFSDKEQDANENVAEEGCYSLTRSKVGSFNSCHSFREEQQSCPQSQFVVLSSLSASSCGDIQRANERSSGNVCTNEATHSFNKGSNDSSLSSITQDPSPNLSDAGGAWQENRKSETPLVDAESGNDSDGKTSVLKILAPELEDEQNISRTDQSFILNTSDEEKMRLRFNNKRQRNGNQLCTYEAFKPTRFNLYTSTDEPSWSTIKRDNSLESSSPTIKKKSVTAKLNPLIGARLARDESPPACNRYSGGAENHKYTVTQKYEDKIRALQQQRQKERSRRRNHSARNEYCVENRDLTFSKISDVSPPSYAEFYKYQSNPTASLPAPSYYLISDDGDSVAIQLSDFVLGSGQVENGKKKGKKGKDKRKETKYEAASSPPVARLNGFVQQQHRHSSAASHYLFNRENRPTKQNGVLQNLESHKRILQSFANRQRESSLEGKTNGEVEKEINSYSTSDYNDDILSNIVQNRDDNQSYKHDNTNQDSVFTSQRTSGKGCEENSSHVLNSPRNNLEQSNNRASSPSVRYTEHVENGFSSNRSRTTGRQFGKKLQSVANGNIQHVTVRSRDISRPLSPKLVMANGRPSSQDVTFKQFSPNCKNEDVASFLVKNIENEISIPMEENNVDHERVSVNCDVENVAKNISKHLVEFCNVEAVNRHKEIEILVTDLDAPDAACPLTKNDQHHVIGNGKNDNGKSFQGLKVLSGPKEQFEVRVYRNPGLGFSIGGGVNGGSQLEGIYVVSVNPDGPSSHVLRSGDRILEVNKLSLRSVSHELAVLFLTYNQQLDLLIERVIQ